VDVPALPAEISSLFDDAGTRAVFDVGGDSAGARAVSRYREGFASEKAEFFFVFNLRRPITSNIEDAMEIFHEIQYSARLAFTAIVNNTNLLHSTEESDLLEGIDAAMELSSRLSLPFAFSARMRPDDETREDVFIQRSLELRIPVFYLEKSIFMDYGKF
jgi:hypothetical protein